MDDKRDALSGAGEEHARKNCTRGVETKVLGREEK